MGPLGIISSFDFVYSLKRIVEIGPRLPGLGQAVDYPLPPFVRAQMIDI